MSVDELVAADPFVLTAADEEVELRALCRALTLADGFSLLFARCNQADHRRELIARIKTQLLNVNIQVIEFREPVTHLLDELRTRITSPLPDAIFVLGLEYSLPRSSDAHSSALIANLNAARNSFPQAMPFPLVLWVPEYILTAIARAAPDFFSIRSGLYSFAAAPKDSMSTVRSVMAGDWVDVSNLTLAEKQERIQAIRLMLSDYESLPTDLRDTHIEGRLHYRLGTLFLLIGSYEEALVEFETAGRRAERLGNRVSLARSIYEIGMVYAHRGQYDKALQNFQLSLQTNEEVGDRNAVATVLHGIANVDMLRGDYERALEHYHRSRKIAEELGDRNGVAGSLHQIGVVQARLGQYAAAQEMFQRPLEIKEELGDRAGVATALHGIGNIATLRGDYEDALKHYQQALKVSMELGNLLGIAASRHQIGMILQHRGEYEGALEEYKRSLEIATQLRDRDSMALSLHQIGNIYYLRGEYDKALEEYQVSLGIAQELGDRDGIAMSLAQMAQVFMATGRYDEAFESLFDALAGLVELQSPQMQATANDLRQLRGKWGEENFDPAWQ